MVDLHHSKGQEGCKRTFASSNCAFDRSAPAKEARVQFDFENMAPMRSVRFSKFAPVRL